MALIASNMEKDAAPDSKLTSILNRLSRKVV